MTRLRDTDQFIREFLQDGLTELPDRTYDAVRSEIDHTRQRVVIGPWREEQVSKFAMFSIAAAAAVLLAVVGIRLLPNLGGVGAQPTPTPMAGREGLLEPGNYVAKPFSDSSISYRLTLPSANWEGMRFVSSGMVGVAWGGNSNGVGFGVVRIHSLNGDPCTWVGTDDDIAIGPTVDDLVNALVASNDFDTTQPVVTTVGAYSGKAITVTMPATGFSGSTALGCTSALYSIWNSDGFDIYAQGPSNRWALRILDVDGERIVLLASDFANSDPLRQTELRQIADSVVINP